ncbi:hypothetical protein [Sphingomonas nostoxanthinifaciens]|uniref:hypothetical protein n=1 Tax=Sphingomonas nostoxanthinifaciens TaxID=2872652 RepID=UPI001CC1ECCC|nr:hypothetical protein [Sphingomonas nostoxanthinifaciens]UAK25186.1 hypothetical protein K8P63_02995 [Sphingomonas nostoxanthinifaciens]
MRGSTALAAMLLAVAPAAAQTPPPPPTDTDNQSITVKGRLPEETKRFVETLSQPSSTSQQLARWNTPICVVTMGLDVPHGRFVIGRVEQVAEQLDIPVDHKRCQPNVVIVSIPNADDFTRKLVKKHPALGRVHGYNGYGGGGLAPPSQIHQLLEPRAVRWFHASITGASSGPDSSGFDASSIGYMASRIQLTTRESATLAFIIVDPDKVVGATWDQLADYLTMVALARPELGADFGRAPSILSLYNADGAMQDKVPSLTREDRAFLQGLYESNPDRAAANQRANIVDRMRHPAANTSH